MKLILFLIACMQITCMYAQKSKLEVTFSNGTKAFLVSDDNIVGGVEDSSGKIIVPKIYRKATIHGNFICCEKEKGSDLYNWKGEKLISDCHDRIDFVLVDGSMIASIQSHIKDIVGLVFNEERCIYKYKKMKDPQGFVYLKNEISDTIIIAPGKYTEFLLWDDVIRTHIGNKVGITRLDGSIIFPALQFKEISPDYSHYERKGFYVNKSKNTLSENYGAKGYYDRDGRCIVPVDDYYFLTRIDNYFHAKKNGFVEILDSLGKRVIMTKYHYLSLKKDNKGNKYYVTFIGNGKGKMTISGKVIEEPKPTKTKTSIYGTEKYILVTGTNGYKGIEAEDGKSILSCEYEGIQFDNNKKEYDDYDNFFKLYKNGYQGIAREDGTLVIPCNKYHIINRIPYFGNNYYKVDRFGKCGLCNKDGKEIVPPLYDDIDIRIWDRKDKGTEKIIVKEGIMEGALDSNGRLVVPFEYTDVRPERRTGNFEVSLFNKKGIIDSFGRIIVPPLYTIISRLPEEHGNYKELYRVSDGNTRGLYTTDGKMLFPTGLFSIVTIDKGQVGTMTKEGLYISGCDKLMGEHYYYDLTGNLLGHENLGEKIFNSLERLSKAEKFDELCEKASVEFEKKNFKSSIDLYEQALNFIKDGTVYYNIGAAYYNMGKFKDAIRSLNACMENTTTQSTIDNALNLISECEQCLQKKREKRQDLMLGIFRTVFNVAATIIQNNNSINNYNNNLHSSNMTSKHSGLDSNLNYLLDPGYAKMRVDIQNWNEYLRMTNGGQTMTYDEWYSIKAKAWEDSHKPDINSLSSISSSLDNTANSSNTSLSNNNMCRICAGTGWCKTCEGKGWYYSSFDLSKEIICPNCHNHDGKCNACGGTGSK